MVNAVSRVDGDNGADFPVVRRADGARVTVIEEIQCDPGSEFD
jgi:hypothetical protein